jgi:hypothetical protein
MRPIDRAVEAHLTTLHLGTGHLPCDGCGECIEIDTDAIAISRKARDGGGPWRTRVYCLGCGPAAIVDPRLGVDEFVVRATVAHGCVTGSALSVLRLADIEVEDRALAGLGDRQQTPEEVPEPHKTAEGY